MPSPDSTNKTTELDAAMAEAIRRYGPTGDVEGALIFYRCATQPLPEITQSDLDWAKEALANG